MFKSIFKFFAKPWSSAEWQYRFRYDMGQGKWLIELTTNFIWVPLQTIVDNRVQIVEHATFQEAKAHADKIGLGNIYSLIGCDENKINSSMIVKSKDYFPPVLPSGPSIQPCTLVRCDSANGVTVGDGEQPGDRSDYLGLSNTAKVNHV